MITIPKIEALLFDLDGTLVDTAPDFIYILNALRKKYQQPPLNDLDIRNTVSNGARALIQLAFGGNEDEPEFEMYRKELLEDYMSIVGEHAKLFSGMPEILKTCEEKSIPWGIITNKPRKFTIKLLERLELNNRCSLLLCADDVQNPKPNPESMFIAAKTLSVNLNHCVYVGDHERDISAGNAAKMITVAAQYGYLEDNANLKDWHASHIIQHPEQLKQLFLS